jgi:hypothetical protein
MVVQTSPSNDSMQSGKRLPDLPASTKECEDLMRSR